MKRVICFLLAFTMLAVTLAGCENGRGVRTGEAAGSSASQDEEETEPDETSQQEEETGGGFSVDRSSGIVELTVPAYFVDELSAGELTDEDRENGFQSMVVNDDGSVTYTIDSADYDKLLEETQAAIRDSLALIPNEYDSISAVELNSAMTEATLTVDRDSYESSLDSLAVFSLYIQVAMYQVFTGVDLDNFAFTITLRDAASGEVYDSYLYRD